jgi:hypothetical protein
VFLIVAGIYDHREEPNHTVVIQKLTMQEVTFRRVGFQGTETVSRDEFTRRYKVGRAEA